MFSVGCLWISLSLSAVAFTLLYFYLSSVNKYWEKLGVPYPSPELLFGNTRQLLFIKEGMVAMLHRLYEQLEGHPFGGFYMMTEPCVIIRDTKLINRIIVEDFSHFCDRLDPARMKMDPMTQHLFALRGSLWKEMRLRMSAAFSLSHTRRVFFLVQDCCVRLQDSVDVIVKGHSGSDFELKTLLASFTTDVIGMCAFGIECGAIDDNNSQFRRVGNMVFEKTKMDAFRKTMSFMLPNVATFLGMKFFSSSVTEFFDRIVTETFKYRQKNGILRDDLIHLMMQLKEYGFLVNENGERIEMTDDLLVAQMLLAFTLGFEMTSSTMSFCLHELSLNPHVQNKVRMEVDEVLSRHGGTLTYDAVQEMDFLDGVVAETLRLYPPFGYVMRMCTKPYHIPDSRVVLQQGTQVYMPLFTLQRDPQYFPEPLSFKPERFSSGRNSLSHEASSAYLPFGNGPRACLGERFALVEVKAGVAALLARFEFRRCPRSSGSPANFDPRTILGVPEEGLWARVATRTWLSIS